MAISDDDRRWLIAGIDENTIWPPARFAEFRKWLRSGGLQAVKYWAEHFEDEFDGCYVKAGEHAPMTEAKRVSIEESRSEAARAVMALAEALAEWAEPGAISYDELRAAARAAMPRHPESEHQLLALAESAGLIKFRSCDGNDRIKVGGRKLRFLVNRVGAELHDNQGGDADVQRSEIRAWSANWARWWREKTEQI